MRLDLEEAERTVFRSNQVEALRVRLDFEERERTVFRCNHNGIYYRCCKYFGVLITVVKMIKPLST